MKQFFEVCRLLHTGCSRRNARRSNRFDTHTKEAFVYGVAKVTLFALFYIRKNTEGVYVVLTVFLRQVYLVCKSIVCECNFLYGLFIP